MTALAGIWRLDGRPDAADDCTRILAAQRIYGPDAQAQWSEGNVALGRALKRVLPEDVFDDQPIVRGERVFVGDARLDNRDALIRELQIPPERARVLSDAAILLSAVERWADDCFAHLAGDYAFALWDGARKSLLLARDPLGRKPLHYHRGKNLFAFATMPKGLHALPEIPYAPDEERIAEVLALLPGRGPRTYFEGIEHVESAHAMRVAASGVTKWRHWNPRRRHIRLKNPDEYAEGLRAHLDEAVRCRLRGTGDIGVSMSGGLDSTAVAATAARLLAGSDRRVVAFTAVPREGYGGVSPRNRFIDESAHAAAVAALYPNMEHVLIRNTDRSPLAALDNIFFYDEGPFYNLCNMGWGTLMDKQMKARGIGVCLIGSYGDFGLSFAGNELLPELMLAGRWLRWWKEARHLTGHGGMRWRGVFAQTFGPWFPKSLWIWLNKKMTGATYDIGEYSAIHPKRLAELNLAARARERGLDFSYRPKKNGFDARMMILRQSDPGNGRKSALAQYGIDVRDPTADIRLLEFCLSVPTDQYLQDGVHRALARRALSDRLPPLVTEERRKGLQAADWHERMARAREEIAQELARLDECPAAARAIDLTRLHRLVDEWPQEGWESDDVIAPYRLAMLRAIAAGHFLRRASRGNA